MIIIISYMPTMSQDVSKHFTCTVSYNSHNSPGRRVLLFSILIFQTRKLRYREVRKLSLGQKAGKWWISEQ